MDDQTTVSFTLNELSLTREALETLLSQYRRDAAICFDDDSLIENGVGRHALQKILERIDHAAAKLTTV